MASAAKIKDRELRLPIAKTTFVRSDGSTELVRTKISSVVES